MIIKRNLSSSILLFTTIAILILLSLVAIHAEEASSSTLNGKAIIEKMSALRKEFKSYSFISKVLGSTELRKYTLDEKNFEQTNPDGTVFERTEDLQAGPITIRNSSGMWKLFTNKNIAINCEYANPSPKDKKNPNSTNNNAIPDDSTYTASEITYENTPCYLVTVNFSNERIEKVTNILKKIDPSMTSRSPMIYSLLFYIRKSDYILCAQEDRDKEGNVFHATYYSDVKFNEPLPASLFEIPKDYTTYEPKSDDEFQTALRKTLPLH